MTEEFGLTLLPSAPVWKAGDALVFDRKFYDGMLMHQGLWKGPLTCVAVRSTGPLPAFGTIEKKPDDLPFRVVTRGPGEPIRSEHLRGSAVVLASGDSFDQFHVASLCRSLGARCVYAIEYIPETRRQILELETPNPILRLRRRFFLWNCERRRRAAFAACHALQSNGTAAHAEYSFVADNLLYFDTRVYRKDLIDDDALGRRLQHLDRKLPLRLAFSGRLIAIKGADHLLAVARGLRARNVAFQLVIYGAGDLEEGMRREIRRDGLEGVVSMPGAVGFYERLLPETKASVDLFVCLHRQSDPSCSYLETLSCGVPIVGYANRAFQGILERSGAGWSAPLGDVAGIVEAIARLDGRREEIAEKSRQAIAFARQHDFETTFRNRMDHLARLLG